MKFFASFAAGAFAIGAAISSAQAAQVVTFEGLPEGTVATTQFPGVVFTGGSVLDENGSLNPTYPPYSGTKVLYDYLDGTITLDFSKLGVTSVGAYVTGLYNVTEYIYNGANLLGQISTGGCNNTQCGTPNIFLNLFGTDITSAVFTNNLGGTADTFTLDDVTIGGTNVIGTVPLPASAPMFGAALLALAGFGYGMNRWVAPISKKETAAA